MNKQESHKVDSEAELEKERFLESVKRGIEDIRGGRTSSIEDVKKEFGLKFPD